MQRDIQLDRPAAYSSQPLAEGLRPNQAGTVAFHLLEPRAEPAAPEPSAPLICSCNQPRARRQSRVTVSGDTLSTAAVSCTFNPPKYRSSTTLAFRGWCWRRGSVLVRENTSRKLQIPQCRACHFCHGCQDSLHYLALRSRFFTRAVLRNALDSISVLIVKRAVGALQLE